MSHTMRFVRVLGRAVPVPDCVRKVDPPPTPLNGKGIDLGREPGRTSITYSTDGGRTHRVHIVDDPIKDPR